MGVARMESIARARSYIRAGVSANRWIYSMREKGLGYARTQMLADYRNEFQIEQKKDLLQYVRKDRYPTDKIIATTTWKLSKEFMYVVNLKKRTAPGEPVIETRVSIQTDAPMTPTMIEERLIEERLKEERYIGETILEIKPSLAFRRV